MDAHEKSSISARVRFADPEPIRKAVLEYAVALRSAHPEIRSIRWFGSWPKETASPGSDVDICILVDRSEKRPRDRIVDFLPRTFPVGIDLFIYTEEELRRLRAEHPSMAMAIAEGVEV